MTFKRNDKKNCYSISIIIPAYNEEKYIEATLKSLKKQTYKDFEIIVVANNCSDNTVALAERDADKVIQTKKQGISLARNLGAEHAKGEILFFLDADTHMKPDLLEKVMDYLNNGYECGKIKLRPLDDDRLRAHVDCYFAELLSLLTSFLSVDSGSGGCSFVTKRLFNKINGFNEKLNVLEDMDFIKKAKMNGKYVFVTNSCVYTSMRRSIQEGYLNAQFESF